MVEKGRVHVMSLRRFLGCSLLAASVLVLPACGGCGGGSSSTGSSGATSSGLPNLSSSSSSSGTPDPVTALEIDPGTLNLQATWGAPQTRDLHARLVHQSGRKDDVTATWESSDPIIARVDSTGRALVTAQRAGTTTVTARAEGRDATATITVTLNAERTLPDADPQAPVTFAGASCQPGRSSSPGLEYPLDDVVLPLNLPSPVFQWSGPAAQVHRITLTGSAATVTLYVSGAAHEMQVPQDLWNVLVTAHAGGQLRYSVDALVDRGDCGRSAQRTIKLASADLSSTVYYWAVNTGQIVRLDVGATRGVRMGIEPSNDQGSRCNACHVLSRDGQQLAFTYYGGNGPGGVVRTSTPETPNFAPGTDKAWNYATFDNSGHFLLTNFQKTFILRNAEDGTPLQTVNVSEAAMPTWSPDGSQVAFSGNILAGGGPAGWEIDFTSSDLMVMSWNAATQQFGAPAVLQSGGGKAIAYASYSADGSHIAYQYAENSRSRQGDTTTLFPGDLMIVPTQGGTPVALATANPDHNSYMPTYSPFVEGGYQWMAFYSRRPYGHRVADPLRPQIWVAALDANGMPSADPSHPPFWLPGQDEGTSNLSSFFAKVPCRMPGGPCTTDVQCCNGQLCRPTANGTYECTPPETACVLAGGGCRTDAECCPGAGTCQGAAEGQGTCSTGGQACRHANESCTGDGDCCPGAGSCRAGSGGALLCTPGATGCRLLGDACLKDDDCCAGAGFCLDQRCAMPGG